MKKNNNNNLKKKKTYQNEKKEKSVTIGDSTLPETNKLKQVRFFGFQFKNKTTNSQLNKIILHPLILITKCNNNKTHSY